ncbi:nitroreductase family protein [Variovorax sp. J31P207]|uniref:nitroreductase family protein n=1 Tax=Variovorax sp. J31P207 TaxID=3053510 RepID=UPI00336593A5
MLTCSRTIRGKSTNEDDQHWQLAGRARRSSSGLVDSGRWSDFNRRFTERPVPDGWIAQMLQKARRASSGANLQPDEFIRIDGVPEALGPTGGEAALLRTRTTANSQFPCR